MKKFKNNAFTLIELMVVISIIAILILGSNFLSFNNISNKEKLNTKIIQINSQIETIRNNALLWKWIWTNLIVPKKYKIDFSTNGSGQILYSYLSWATYQKYNLFDKKIDFSNQFESISEINCLKLDWWTWSNSPLQNTETWTIFIEGANMTLSWNCDTNTKILDLTIKRKQDTKKIQINTLNWLIEIVK